jgi:hypothetical protein
MSKKTIEHQRIDEDYQHVLVPKWQKWGPYLSERSWGTVREDYSEDGDAWNYFPHDRAPMRAYRWGEEGIAGWCDRYQVLCLAPVFWNGVDSILKERLFGLSIFEGNHGEDVKEVYYHLDATPTHSYMKYLYKYPQAKFPYEQLREENQKRTTHDMEYELIDTGVFEEGRYFDVVIEYAKQEGEDLCIKVEVFNRGPDSASFHYLMQLWFRNQWAWGEEGLQEPEIKKGGQGVCLVADDRKMAPPAHLLQQYILGERYLYGPDGGKPLFTNNETFKDQPGYYKDGIQRHLIEGQASVNPEERGTKACLHYKFDAIAPGKSQVLLFRFTDKPMEKPLDEVESIVQKRKEEADEFYETIHSENITEEEKRVQRQALAGVVWSKQSYLFDVNQWLKGDKASAPPPESRQKIRNFHWQHLNSMRILLMPDKWEYPWFAAWDHAFHCLTYALLDIQYAKEQLWLLLFDQFQHPNGQIPAYEWEFSDLNPPVQAWAALRLYLMEEEKTGKKDRAFLEKCFHKLILNFTWWVNKVDNSGNNVFEGGFLGLDNITVLDRSEKLPGGAVLQQSDGTGWMAMFSLNLMRMALLLAEENKTYESLATKFFEHYVYIAHAMKKRGNRDYEMWSDRDGFFYDVLTYPDGTYSKFRIRSLVGLIPLYAIEILHEDNIQHFPEFARNFHWFMNNRKDLVEACIIPTTKDNKKHYVLTLMNHDQLQSVLKYVWDPEEFRAKYGLRSMSRFHEKNPFVFKENQVGYEPAESLYRVKGGNSNWRGPIWMPTTFLLVNSLKKLTEAYEENITVTFKGEEPVDIEAMASCFAKRVVSIFLPDKDGKRPVFGPAFPYHSDPYWKDHLLFYEYYNPEDGRGMGSCHQTGWSALVANFIDEFCR